MDPYFEIYEQQVRGLMSALQGKYRWRFLGGNHEPIASGEGYHDKADCWHAVTLLQETNLLTPVVELTESQRAGMGVLAASIPKGPRFEIYREQEGGLHGLFGEWRWRFQGGNGKIVASGESYTDKAHCRRAIELLQRAGPLTRVVDLTANQPSGLGLLASMSSLR